jgi:uracil-DNA glycosylase
METSELSDRAQLIEYLRQRVELGDHELYLDSISASEFVGLLNTNAGKGVGHATHAPLIPTPIPNPSPSSAVAVLTVLQQQAAACTACGLHAERTNSVFARGDATSPIVVVGEAPGEEEDKTGLPFVGRAGKLLDLMLAAVGYPKDSVYICNTLKCRPPGNRNPMPNELAACNRFLKQQLEVVAPKVLLAVGKFAAQTLLQSEEPIGRLRGRIHTYEGRPVVVTYHPAYLLRSPIRGAHGLAGFPVVATGN